MQAGKQTNGNIGQTFGRRLAEARGERTQKVFMRELGINSQAVYCRYEKGRLPSALVLCEIAEKLGVSVDYLLGATRTGCPLASSDGRSTGTATHSSCGTMRPAAVALDRPGDPQRELPPPGDRSTSADRTPLERTEAVRRAFRSGVVSLSQPMLLGLLADNQLSATYGCVRAINEAISRLGRTRIGREALFSPEIMQMPAPELARFLLAEALAVLAPNAHGTTQPDLSSPSSTPFSEKSTR